MFNNKDGSLTSYALACGYIDVYSVPGGRFEVRLSLDGEYMVKVSDSRLEYGLTAWENYTTLTEARKAVRDAVRYYKNRADVDPVPRSMTYAPAPWEVGA